jgi:DNA-binding NarL/FixJ family response regulator
VLPLAVIDENALFRHGLQVGLQEAGLPAEEADDLRAWARLGGRRAAVVTASNPTDLSRMTEARAVNPGLVVVIIAEQCNAPQVARSLKAGAAACVSRSSSFDELVQVVRLAMQGTTVIRTELAHQIVATARVVPGDCPVSARETNWIRSLARGGTVTKLAQDSGYSEREMYRILHQTYDRMGARNRAEALVRAASWGLLD